MRCYKLYLYDITALLILYLSNRSQLGWEPALGYRECSSILLGVIKIPRPVLYPLVSSTGGPEQRQRGGVRGSVYRRDEDRGRSSRSSFGYSSSAGSRWRSTAREETQGEASSVCLDHSGIASMFCRTVQLIHRSVSNFVSKTSILQSVNNSSSVGTPTVELYSSGASHHTAIRTVSGELDGGNADF